MAIFYYLRCYTIVGIWHQFKLLKRGLLTVPSVDVPRAKGFYYTSIERKLCCWLATLSSPLLLLWGESGYIVDPLELLLETGSSRYVLIGMRLQLHIYYDL